jgi:hypothetical protein
METQLLQAYVALLVMALIPIVIGSYRSLNSKSVRKSKKKTKKKDRNTFIK